MSNNNQNTTFVPLGSVAKSVKGKKPAVLKEKAAAGWVPYIDIEAFEDGVFKRYTDPAKTVLCGEGDVLMVWDGARAGLVGRGKLGALGSTLAKIEIPNVEKPYLFYFLESLYPVINSRAKGVGIPHVNPELLWSSLFPVVSEKQQQLIVAKIEELLTELNNGIKELEEAQAELKRYRASVLAAACSGKLVPIEAELAKSEGHNYETGTELLARILKERHEKWNGRGKYKEPATPDMTDLLELPKGWVWANIDQLGFVSGGITKNSKNNTKGALTPYLRVANVYANELRLDEIEKINVQENALKKLLLEKFDLLIVEGNGSKDQIGRVALWDASIDPCVHQNHLIRVRLILTEMANWGLHWLLSWSGRNQIEKAASSTSGLYTLSISKVAALPIPIPPIAEQVRIIGEIERRLSVADEIEQTLSVNLQRADYLRQSILQQAFTGKLVPQVDDAPQAKVRSKPRQQKNDYKIKP